MQLACICMKASDDIESLFAESRNTYTNGSDALTVTLDNWASSEYIIYAAALGCLENMTHDLALGSPEDII